MTVKSLKRNIFCFIIFISGIFFAVSIFAQAHLPADRDLVLRIGLDEIIKMSLETSEELQIKEQEVDKKEGGYKEARSGVSPHIDAQSTWTHNMNYPDSAANEIADYALENGISVSQVIWSFGKVAYAVDSAKKAVEASVFNKEAGRQDVIYAAKLGYYSSLLARNTLSITEKSYANALDNKRLLEQRSYGGRSPKYEIIRMNAEVAARVPTVHKSRTQFGVAMETLKRIINADSDCRIELTGDFKKEYNGFDYSKLVTLMAQREPNLKSLDKAIESAQAEVKSKKAGLLPTVSVFGGYSYLGGSNQHRFLSDEDLDSYTLAGIKVSVPVWEGGVKQAQLSQSKADREIAVLRKKQAQENLSLELKKSFLEYKQYKENLKANIEAVDLAEESFKQMQEMFASGQVTLTDVNDAELLLTNQRLNKEITLFNINITAAKIEKLIAGEYDEPEPGKKSWL